MTQPFQFANGQLAHSAEDLLQLCQQFPDDGTNYLVREDLEKWLAYIGKEDIAQCAANARQTAVEDRQKLEEFLTKCHALSSSEVKSSVSEAPKVEETEVTKTVEVEPKQEPTPVVTEAAQKSSEAKSTTDQKPSFLQVIAKFVMGILN